MKSIRATWKGALIRLLILTISTALSLAVAETLVRRLSPQQLIRLRPDIWTPDQEGLGWRMASHVDTRVNTGERDVRLLTDADGHRIGARSALPAEHRILALGDSFLAAIEVDYADTMTALLERRLSAAMEERVQVVNSGVAGWDPNHYLLKARAELARHSYDLVLVFLFLGNDAVDRRRETIPPKRSEVIHDLRWPRSLGSRELVKAWLYPINDDLERRSHFFVLLRRRAWQLMMRAGVSARRFPKSDLRSQADSQRWKIAGELCADISTEASTSGLHTLFVLVPGAYHVDTDLGYTYASALGLERDDVDLEQSRTMFTIQLEKRGLRFVDVTAALRRLHGAGTPTHGQVDTHLSPAGHSAVAAELLEPALALLRPTTD